VEKIANSSAAAVSLLALSIPWKHK